jgi:hypothetical protein
MPPRSQPTLTPTPNSGSGEYEPLWRTPIHELVPDFVEEVWDDPWRGEESVSQAPE